MANVALNIVVGGEEKAKQAIKELNGNIKQLGTNMKSLDEVFASNQNSYDYLSAKLKNLTEAQEAYRKKTETLPGVIEFLRGEQNKLADKTDALKQKMEQATAAYDNAEDKTAALKRAMNEATKEFNDNQKALNYARDAANDYQRQLTEAEGKVDVLGEEIRKTNGYLKEAAVSADGTATSIDRYGKEAGDAAGGTIGFSDAVDMLSHVLVASGVAKGVEKLKDIMVDCAKASIEFESAFAGVEKTVDGTDEELKMLSDGIKELATKIPLTTTELAKIAETAGQLGIAKGDILTFTEVVANLAATTDLSAEEAAVSLARIANITGLMTNEYSNFGSTLVDLGNNSAAFESEILEMTNRLAGTGSIVEATNAQLLGIATTLVSVGIEAEAGGTAFSTLLSNIELAVQTGSQKVQQYAQVAGMSAKEFSDAWRNDAIGAVAAFIEGLGDLDSQGESAIVVLNDMGITEKRLRDSVLKLTEAEGLLTENLKIANEAWSENNALTEEAEKRYETTESKITLAKTAINNLKITIGDELLEQFDGFIGKFTDLVTECDKFIKQNPDVVTGLRRLKAALGINDELNDASDAVDDLVASLQTLKTEYSGAADAAAKKGVYDETKRVYEELSDKIDEYGEKAKESSLNLAALREEQRLLLEQQNETYAEEMADATKSAGLQLKIQQETEAVLTYIKASNALREQQEKTAEDLAKWEKEMDDIDVVPGDLPNDLEEAEDAFAKFIGTLKTSGQSAATELNAVNDAISAGFNEKLIQSLYESGDETKTLFSDIITELHRLEAEYGKNSEETKAFVEQFNSAWSETAYSVEMLEGVTEQLFSTEERAAKAAEEAAKKAEQTAKDTEKAAKKAAEESAKAAEEAQKRIGESLKQQAKDTQSALDTLTKEYNNVYTSTKSALDGIGGLFGEVAFKAELSIEDMIRGLETQADYMIGYMQNIQRAAQIGLDEGLVAALSDGSDESAGYIQKIITEFNKLESEYGANSEQAQEFITRFNEAFKGSQQAKDTLAHNVAEMSTDFAARKDRILLDAQSLLDNLSVYTGDSVQEVAEAVYKVTDEVEKSLGSIAEAVERKGGEAAEAAADVREDIDETFEDTEKTGEEAGENYIAGIVKGLLDGSTDVAKAAKEIAQVLIDAVNKELGINSPSKEGEQQGDYYDQGIALGIEENADKVISSAEKMIFDLADATEASAKAAGLNIGQTISAAAAQELGASIRKMAESGTLYYNGKQVGTAASAGIPSLSGQEAADWNAQMVSRYPELAGKTNQEITDWLNGGGFLSGGTPPNLRTDSASEKLDEAVKTVTSAATMIDNTIKKVNNSFYYGTPTTAGTSVTVNQTINNVKPITPYTVKKAAEEGVKTAVYG